MSKFYSVLIRGAVGCAATAVLAGCQMMALGTDISSSVVDASADSLVLGEPQRGELTTQSPLNVKDGSRYQTYSLSLEAGSIIEVEVSGSFEGVLSLYDDENTLLMVDSPLGFRAEEGGDYAVVVSGDSADSYGPFRVSYRSVALNDTGELVTPGTINGWLQSEPRTYTLTVDEPVAYRIDVASSDFDSVLALLGPNGYYKENDDGGTDRNASIGDMFEPGEYTLTVGSYGGESGLYAIEISILDIEISDTDTLTVGSEITGWMRSGSDSYSLTIEEEGEYQVDMQSTSFDSVVVIDGPDEFYCEDDDGGEDYNSRIVETMKPGTYQVHANSHEESRVDGGIYSLSVQRL